MHASSVSVHFIPFMSQLRNCNLETCSLYLGSVPLKGALRRVATCVHCSFYVELWTLAIRMAWSTFINLRLAAQKITGLTDCRRKVLMRCGALGKVRGGNSVSMLYQAHIQMLLRQPKKIPLQLGASFFWGERPRICTRTPNRSPQNPSYAPFQFNSLKHVEESCNFQQSLHLIAIDILDNSCAHGVYFKVIAPPFCASAGLKADAVFRPMKNC